MKRPSEVFKFLSSFFSREHWGVFPFSLSAEGGKGAVRSGSFRFSSDLFLSGLAALHAVNFWNLYLQGVPLIGVEGLDPIAAKISRIEAGGSGFWDFPSLAWWFSSDGTIRGGAALGMLLAAGAFFGYFQRLSFLALFFLCLSYVLAGGEFFSFQWDSLILESTAMALLLPMRVAGKVGERRTTGFWEIFLMQWLAFRLHFESGISKIGPGASGWTDWSAMTAYFETAPIPTAMGWYAHHLQEGILRAASAGTLLLEILVPILIFTGKGGRRVAFVFLMILQIAIVATANYGIFNYNAMLLLLFLVDDRDWKSMLDVLSGGVARASFLRTLPAPQGEILSWNLKSFLGALLLAASLVSFLAYVADPGLRAHPVLGPISSVVSKWRISSAYHLFAGMTTRRIEVEIEGSKDAKEWKLYGWKYKPQDPKRSPRLLAPFHPRLDFKMWFYPLAMRVERHGYFNALVSRLCENPPAACVHFETCPFPEEPPRIIRVAAWDYRMASLEELRTKGIWWTRKKLGYVGQPYLCNSEKPPRF